ncbi:MAG: hypothetical protein COA79_25160 [Planctomycetota bacterium]|nr:MAG: hypothetical protein COA79_25160 [Planctomycetota bacterium]
MKTTLKDIAKECNLDISTVSRALSNDVRVKVKTKNIVKEVAQRLHYKPNLAARSLAAGRTKMIFLLLGSLEGTLERRAAGFGSSYINSKGFDLYISLHNSDPEVYQRQFERISLGLTDGAIISPNRQINSQVLYDNCLRDDIPVIFFDQHFENLKTPVVTSDNHNAVQQLITDCLKKGAKKFYVLFDDSNSVEKIRKKSSIQYLRKNNVPYEIVSSEKTNALKIQSLKRESIGIIGTSQGKIISFYKENKNYLSTQDLIFACFDHWIGSCYPSRNVVYAIQNYEKMISTAIDKIVEFTETKISIKSEIFKVPILEFKIIDS